MHTTRSQLLHVSPGEGDLIQIGGFGTQIMVPHAATGGSVSVVEHTLAPGLLGAPPHTHAREDETSYVMEGALTVQVGDEIATVRPGGIVVKPRGIPHTFWNAGDEPLRFIEVISPGGFEDYFRELAGVIPADGPPDLGRLVALAARYGMELDLAALPALLQRHGLRMG